jgi:hypothetical protein
MSDAVGVVRGLWCCLEYLLHFARRGLPASARFLDGADGMRWRKLIDGAVSVVLFPEAEGVVLEWVLETYDGQSEDVRAVFLRLVQEIENAVASGCKLEELAQERRKRYPGVIESE